MQGKYNSTQVIIFCAAENNRSLTANGHPFSKWIPIGYCSLFFKPFKKCVSGNPLPVAFFLFRSGPFAPVVKLLVGDPSGFDPCKAPLVFLAIGLESIIACLPERPLLQSADVTAALLPSRNRPPAILRADSSGLRKVPPAVLAAPHGDVSLHAAPQRVVDHIPNTGGIEHRRAASRLHRLKAERDGMERKQVGIFRRVMKVIRCRLCLRLPSCAVHVQHQIKKSPDLFLIQRKLLGKLP